MNHERNPTDAMPAGSRRRVAVVTGAGVRLGAAIARGLAGDGYDVLVHARSHATEAAHVARDVETRGGRSSVVTGDLTDDAFLAQLASAARRFSGDRLDLLVHNAGSFEDASPETMDGAAWDRSMALNARAPFVLSTLLREPLRRAEGAIIGITCLSAERPWRSRVPYSVSKAAFAHALKALAVAWAPEIRVNGVAPGTVLPPETESPASVDALVRKIPLGRVGDPRDVVDAVLHLARARFVTGQIVSVDGGRSLV